MAAYEVLLLNTAIPQIQAAQSGDTYVVPRDIAFSTVASFAAGTAALPSIVATGDTNTGIWFPAADTFAISTAGAEAVRINASGNLGLGTATTTNGRLNVQAGTSATGNSAFFGNPDGTYNPYLQIQHSSAGVKLFNGSSFGAASNNLIFGNSGTSETMRIDGSGNLGLGVTPSAWSGVKAFDAGATGCFYGSSGDLGVVSNAYYNGTNWIYKTGTVGTPLYASRYQALVGTGVQAWFTAPTGVAGGTVSFSQAMTLDASSNLLIGQTLRGLRDSNSFDFDVTDSSAYINHVTGSASGSTYVYFGYAAGAIGSISQNGTTGVLYNITSDYRLKDVVGAVTGAGARIDALKPVDYTWKADGSAARGFLAHEFQAVYPNSVTGTKDAVDEEGKPVYQNMQASTSEVIADLVAELQSLRARVAQLEGK